MPRPKHTIKPLSHVSFGRQRHHILWFFMQHLHFSSVTIRKLTLRQLVSVRFSVGSLSFELSGGRIPFHSSLWPHFTSPDRQVKPGSSTVKPGTYTSCRLSTQVCIATWHMSFQLFKLRNWPLFTAHLRPSPFPNVQIYEDSDADETRASPKRAKPSSHVLLFPPFIPENFFRASGKCRALIKHVLENGNERVYLRQADFLL